VIRVHGPSIECELRIPVGFRVFRVVELTKSLGYTIQGLGERVLGLLNATGHPEPLNPNTPETLKP